MERKLEVKITESDRDSTSLNRRLDRFFPDEFEEEEEEDIIFKPRLKYLDELDESEQFSAVNEESSIEGISDDSGVEGSDIGSSEGVSDASYGDSGSDAGGDGDG
jgi:hypothetical protein